MYIKYYVVSWNRDSRKKVSLRQFAQIVNHLQIKIISSISIILLIAFIYQY